MLNSKRSFISNLSHYPRLRPVAAPSIGVAWQKIIYKTGRTAWQTSLIEELKTLTSDNDDARRFS